MNYLYYSPEELIEAALNNIFLLNFILERRILPSYVLEDYIELAEKTNNIEAISLLIEYKASLPEESYEDGSSFDLGDIDDE